MDARMFWSAGRSFVRLGAVLLLVGFAGVDRVSAQDGDRAASALGVSNAMNPAISFNGLFLGTWSDAREIESAGEESGEHAEAHAQGAPKDGMAFQEGELILSSVVDPYFHAFVTIASSPEEGTGIEEAYAYTTFLPRGLGLRAGKMYLPFGRHNPLHTHQFPFVTPPVGVSAILGHHGITDAGVEASALLPLPAFVEVVAYATDGSAERFDGEADRLAAGGRAYSLVELGDATTLELGGSTLSAPLVSEPTEHTEHEGLAGLAGRARLAEGAALEEGDPVSNDGLFWGVDFALRWQELRRSFGPALQWQTELIGLQPEEGSDALGFYTVARYRFARSWWISSGYSLYREDLEAHDEEKPDAPHEAGDSDTRSVHEVRGQLAFVPSEYSTIRAEVCWQGYPDDRLPSGADRPDEWTAYLQVNFTIGSHPAHKY